MQGLGWVRWLCTSQSLPLPCMGLQAISADYQMMLLKLKSILPALSGLMSDSKHHIEALQEGGRRAS